MGSAQSAWRIQPSVRPDCAGGTADLSRSPFLPTPRHSSLCLQAGGKRKGGGDRGGRQAGPRVGLTGDHPRPATRCRWVHFHRGGMPPLAPGWLKRPGRKRWLGGPHRLAVVGPPSPSVTAPWQQRSLTSGAEGASPHHRALPPPCALPPAGGGARVSSWGGVSECTTGLSWPALERPPGSQLIWPK